MKYIPSKQIGGNVFFHASQAPQLAGSGSAAAASAGTAGSLISEDILKNLGAKGITSDVNKFMGDLATIESKYRFTSVPQSVVYKLQADANKIINQAKNLESAEKEATKNDALSDIAVDDNGRMFVLTEKGVSQKNLKDYNPEKELALTVGQLIDYRKNDPNLADADFISTVVKKSVGMTKINDYIQKIIKAAGTATNSTDAYHELAAVLGRDAVKPTQQQQYGLQEAAEILENLGPDALFRIKDEKSSKNVQEALAYIYKTLPANMRMQLRANYVASGGKAEDADRDIYDMIAVACDAGNITKSTYSQRYDKTVNEAAGTTAGKQGTVKTDALTNLQMLVQGTLNPIDYKISNPHNPSLQMTLHGSGMPTLTYHNGNLTGAAPLDYLMNEVLASMVDVNHMSIGDEKLTPDKLQKIMYDGHDVVNVWAPVDANGDVDLRALARLQAVQEKIKNEPLLETEDKNVLLQQEGLPGYYDEQGIYHQTEGMEQFLVFTGVTSGKIVDPDTNEFSYKMPKRETEYLKDSIKATYARLNGNKKGDAKYEFPFQMFGTDFINAPVFMKLNRTAQGNVGAYAGNGPVAPKVTYQQQMEYDRRRQLPTIQTPSTSLLFN